MTEKIEWYQEVFDIEPTSRIFLPLARLLKGEGALDRAVSVLQRGLVFHADMLEARLLLIECLFVQQDTTLLATEMQKVTDVLKIYPTFFEAWAKLAQAQSKDLALAVRLLSYILRDPSSTFVDIVARGLDECPNAPPPSSEPTDSTTPPPPRPSAGLGLNIMSDAEADALLADTIAMDNTLSVKYAVELAELNDMPDTDIHRGTPVETPVKALGETLGETPGAIQERMPASHLSIGSEAIVSSEKPVATEMPISTAISETIVTPDESVPVEAMPTSGSNASLMPDTLVMPRVDNAATLNDTALIVDLYDMGAMPDIYNADDTMDMPSMPDLSEGDGFFGMTDAQASSKDAAPTPYEPKAVDTKGLSSSPTASQGEMPSMTELFDASADIFEVTDAQVKSTNSPKPSGGTLLSASDSAPNAEGTQARNETIAEHDAELMLRTRSMADLLAEQGGLDEAMAIYLELEAQETEVDELAILQARIAKLRVQRGEVIQNGGVQEKAVVPDSPVKGRVLTVLEALAARLEARALA